MCEIRKINVLYDLFLYLKKDFNLEMFFIFWVIKFYLLILLEVVDKIIGDVEE